MKKIAEKIFTGYKWNGKKLVYKLNVYDEYEPQLRKKFETIEKNIIKYFEKKKVFEFYTCDYVPINDKIKRKWGDTM